jgi:hypothetical protein
VLLRRRERQGTGLAKVDAKAMWATNGAIMIKTVLRVTPAAEEGQVDLDIRVGSC